MPFTFLKLIPISFCVCSIAIFMQFQVVYSVHSVLITFAIMKADMLCSAVEVNTVHIYPEIPNRFNA